MKSIILICLLMAASMSANSDQRIERAASAFQELMHTPDKGIPHDLLERANCIVIIPGLKKGAFGFGGKYGRASPCVGDAADGARRPVSESKARVSGFSSAAHQPMFSCL
jgi:lipid-binding SYLF domain-containing protein